MFETTKLITYNYTYNDIKLTIQIFTYFIIVII
jgi:hypothetical protein